MIQPLTPGCTLLPWQLGEISLMTFPGIWSRIHCSDLRSVLRAQVFPLTTGNKLNSDQFFRGNSHMRWFPGWKLGMGNKPSKGSQISTLSQQQMKNAGKWCWLIFPVGHNMTHLYIQCCCVAVHWWSCNKWVKSKNYCLSHIENTLQLTFYLSELIKQHNLTGLTFLSFIFTFYKSSDMLICSFTKCS